MSHASNYDTLRNDTQVWFQKLKPVYSEALQQVVHFTSESFQHIIYKRARAERDKASQIMRFKLLPRAVSLVELSTTFQEYEEEMKSFEIKKRKKRVQQSKKVQYWGIIAIIDGRKSKVIVRKIGGGNDHFWSVILAWTTNNYRNLKLVSTMKGSPHED